MINPDQLSPEQIRSIRTWAEEGLDLNAIQKRLHEDLNIKLTFMDTRFLLQDLDIRISQPEPEPEAPPPEPEPIPEPEPEPEPEPQPEPEPEPEPKPVKKEVVKPVEKPKPKPEKRVEKPKTEKQKTEQPKTIETAKKSDAPQAAAAPAAIAPGPAAQQAGAQTAHAGNGISTLVYGEIDDPFLTEVKRAVEESLHYPRKARMFHIEGTAVVQFIVNPSGKLTELTIYKSAGHPLLDKAAMRAVSDAESRWSRPKGTVRLRFPIQFQLKG